MSRVLWDPAAEQDLREIAHYVGRQRQSPEGARSILRAIRRKCKLYATQPEMGESRPDLEPGIRVFGVGSYVVLYFPIEDGIHVIRVFEGHRDYPALFGRK